MLPSEWFSSGRLELLEHQYDAVRGADAMILVTEWKPFRHPDFAMMKHIMKHPVIFDGRNQYTADMLRTDGFEYFGIGRHASARALEAHLKVAMAAK
jgi:UDPglucose 6-dehydrogenase